MFISLISCRTCWKIECGKCKCSNCWLGAIKLYLKKSLKSYIDVYFEMIQSVLFVSWLSHNKPHEHTSSSLLWYKVTPETVSCFIIIHQCCHQLFMNVIFDSHQQICYIWRLDLYDHEHLKEKKRIPCLMCSHQQCLAF